MGARLRLLRKERGLSARALAMRLGISPSAISQIERGVLQPSVSRLIAITDALDVPLASVFDERRQTAVRSVPSEEGFTLERAEDASPVTLDSGVRVRRLAPGRVTGFDFFESTYPPGSTAHSENELFRHEGYEIGTVTAGELTIDFSDERIVLRPGDAISFASSRAHRIHNTGAVDAVAQWLIVHPGR